MTDKDFTDLLVALRAEMTKAGQDARLLKAARNQARATLPLPGRRVFTVERAHIDGLGTAEETAAAVYAEYLEESNL